MERIHMQRRSQRGPQPVAMACRLSALGRGMSDRVTTLVGHVYSAGHAQH